MLVLYIGCVFFFFKQKTAYEMRISDWSSDVCSSDLVRLAWLWIHHAIPLAGWVAPFGDPGIKARSQLPQAFRSVPRPSSPLGAKASTKCPSALDCRPIRHAQRQDPGIRCQRSEIRCRTADSGPPAQIGRAHV